MADRTSSAGHYCPACGEQVLTYSVGTGERAEIRCSYCGLPLEHVGGGQPAGSGCVMVVDDDAASRSLLADLLTREKLATEVVSCDSGVSFLTAVTQRFRREQAVRLVIIDIVMIPLDGVASALAMRALERGFERSAAIPVLFFSVARATETLRKQMARSAPAYYLNKASDATPERLSERMRDLFGRILTGSGEPLSLT